MNPLKRLSLGLQKRFGRQRLRRILLGAIPFLVLGTLWQMNAVYGWLAPSGALSSRFKIPAPA